MSIVLKNSLYNFIGSFTYLFSQWLMTILVVRLSGSYEEAGVFGTALSVGNIFYMFATFSIRNYQVADVNEKFSNGEYISYRIITCMAALIILPIFLIVMDYPIYLALSVSCYMVIKIAEAMVDVFQGVFQKAWRLDIVCRSFVIRGIVNLLVFCLLEFYFKNLVVSLLFTAFASLACSVLLDFLPCKSMFEINISFKNKKLITMFMCCLPMCVHGLLSTLIYNVPRITAQKIYGEELFGFYASVAAPTVIIQVIICNIFSPLIMVMSEQYHKKEKKLFNTIAWIQSIIIFFSVLILIVFYFVGDFFLEIVFGDTILAYKNLLLPSLMAAGLMATTAFIAAIFTVVDQNILLVFFEGLTFIIDFVLSIILIDRFGLQGINYALIIACVFFIIVGYIWSVIKISQNCRLTI